METKLNEETLKDFESLQDTFYKFSETLNNRIEDLKALDKTEIVQLKDNSLGLTIEMHSRVLPVDQLLNKAKEGFSFLKNGRK